MASIRPHSAPRPDLRVLTSFHRRVTDSKSASIRWRLDDDGIVVEGDGGKIRRTPGEPATVRRIWLDNSEAIIQASEVTGVPVELIIATAATESKGRADAIRKEPGYTSDKATPHRISPGIMQTLISTAGATLRTSKVTRSWLLRPGNSIIAGASYMAEQFRKTNFDPPVVAAAYNAGGVYTQNGAKNRWKMRQFPIGTGHHCDRFVLYFNDTIAMLRALGHKPKVSFVAWLDGDFAAVSEGSSEDEVLHVQTRLKELGYHEVGMLDGKWGKRSRAAALAFRADNGLPLVDGVDDDLVRALKDAPYREISPERATGTPKGSRIVTSQNVQIAGGVAGAAASTATATTAGKDVADAASAATEAASGAVEKAEQAKGVIERGLDLFGLTGSIGQYLPWVIAAICVVIVIFALRARSARINDYRIGKTP